MISNERRWPSHVQTRRQPNYPPRESAQTRPSLREDTLASGELQIERKDFLVLLKQNARGRFLRITEYTRDRNNSIIIPAPGLRDFQKFLADMVKADGEIPAKNQLPLHPATGPEVVGQTGGREP